MAGPADDRRVYYPVWVSAAGRVSLRWGPPCDTPADAARLGKAEVRAGTASLSFVVEVRGGAETPLPNWTYPEAARKVVMHYERLWDATDTPDPEEP